MNAQEFHDSLNALQKDLDEQFKTVGGTEA